jgi:hypothetical protein
MRRVPGRIDADHFISFLSSAHWMRIALSMGSAGSAAGSKD